MISINTHASETVEVEVSDGVIWLRITEEGGDSTTAFLDRREARVLTYVLNDAAIELSPAVPTW